MIELVKKNDRRWPYHIAKGEKREATRRFRPIYRDGIQIGEPGCPESGTLTRGEWQNVPTGIMQDTTLCGETVVFGDDLFSWIGEEVKRYDPKVVCAKCDKSYKAKNR